jgi:hypothetical protein
MNEAIIDAIVSRNLKGIAEPAAFTIANLFCNQAAHAKRLNDLAEKAMQGMLSPSLDPMAEIRERVANFHLR